MHTDPEIHLSRFHEFVMRDAMPAEVANSFDQLHRDLIPLLQAIREAEEALEVKRGEIAEFIRVNRLKSHQKPKNYDPAPYTALLEELATGARQPSGVMPEGRKREPRKPIPKEPEPMSFGTEHNYRPYTAEDSMQAFRID